MKRFIGVIVFFIGFCSCVPNTPKDVSARANFEALWKIIDERYCFLEEKGVDWDSVYHAYNAKIQTGKYENDFQLFSLLDQMLAELKDGHVNLISPFDVSGYSAWQGDDTKGLNIYARRPYLVGASVTGGMYYNFLSIKDKDINFAYLFYSSFSSSLGNMPLVLKLCEKMDAIVLDLRGNGGGVASSAEQLVSYFIDKKELVGYTSYKTGPGRDQFSGLKPLYISPHEGVRWTKKPLIVLQDRGCYSACNDFLSKIRVAKNVITIGLPSGGGGGLPSSAELPNGWKVRYSAVRSFDKDKKSIEGGIAPMVTQSLPSYYEDPSTDDLILRKAAELLVKILHKE